MKILLSAVLFTSYIALGATLEKWYTSEKSDGPSRYETSCDIKRNITLEYRTSHYEYIINTYKVSTQLSKYNVIYAPTSIWLTLAAVAEGASPTIQDKLFEILYLPKDPCVRQKYYKMATSIITPGPDVDIANKRVLTVDEGLKIDGDWLEFVTNHSLLEIVSATIKNDPELAVYELRKVISNDAFKLDVNGNSVLLNAMDFKGFWTTAFSDEVIERAPFYSTTGKHIGYVDLMTLRTKVRMAYSPTLQAKVLELPLGTDGRYFIILVVAIGEVDFQSVIQKLTGNVISEYLEQMHDSEIPIDIAIPRFTMTSEIDAKVILDNLGVPDLWTNAEATRYISEPGILPSSFVQRATITLDTAGVNPAPFSPAPAPDVPTGLDPRLGREFRADKPFLFALFDRHTYTCLMASAYHVPTYSL